MLLPSAALAQVQLQGILARPTRPPARPSYAAALGIKVWFLELDLEGGRFTNVLPSGVLDALQQLEQQHNLPVQAIASVPVTCGLAKLRLIAPDGALKPFVGGGLGIAHLEPQIDVSVSGINLGDIFGLTAIQPQNEAMAVGMAGLRLDFGAMNVEGGYRYIVIFSQAHAQHEHEYRQSAPACGRRRPGHSILRPNSSPALKADAT